VPSAQEVPAGGEPPRSDIADAGQGASTPPAVQAAPGIVATVVAGIREPIVLVLLLIAFFTWISGKPLDGLLMLVVGVSLAWDTGRRWRQGSRSRSDSAGSHPADLSPGTAQRAPPGMAQGAPPAPARGRRRGLVLAWLAGGALYVVVVGSFSRYSWPATAAVVALGAAVVAAGWRDPRHPARAPAKLPTIGLALWGLVLVAGCLWELTSLFEQPSLTTDSYAHPTISTLTDPVLSSWAGRSVILAAWLGLGWFLAER
jgi:hypothetical protein